MASEFSPVDEANFRANLELALRSVSRVLNVSQRPRLASDVHHRYEDKFALAEYVVKAAIASQLHCLSRIGLTASLLVQLAEWATSSAVSLEFRADESCAFVREETKEVESKSKHVTETKVAGPDGTLETVGTTTSKLVTTVTTYIWAWECKYEIVAYAGVGEELRAVLQQGVIREQLTTNDKTTPRRELELSAAVQQLNITWLLKNVNARTFAPTFHIIRGGRSCMTPRRNAEAEAALTYFNDYSEWSREVYSYFFRSNVVLPSEEDCGGFAPVWPLLIPDKADQIEEAELSLADIEVVESGNDEALGEQPSLSTQLSETAGRSVSRKFLDFRGEDGSFTREELTIVLQRLATFSEEELRKIMDDLFQGVPVGGEVNVHRIVQGFFPEESHRVLSAEDTNSLLAEERRALSGRCRDFAASHQPENRPTVSLVTVLLHGRSVARQLVDGLEFLELMLRQQLIAAIGKIVTPGDFAEYMRFHNRKLFREQYLPKHFCYAVRRSNNHAPEGILSIEAKIGEPIMTAVSSVSSGHLMRFPLAASIRVGFRGERHIHAACLHQFSSQKSGDLHLEARAHQFSSMIVLIGRISSATEFLPKYAAIIKNKDDLTIPLELQTIPAPKEFRDAIQSLSPEQRAFAQAYRAMQLESTLFGILVIQIKPPMERLLGLPEGSLSQELKLTQDLMELFITYQIPSDLLVYKGDPAAAPEVKVETVRRNVEAMQNVFKDGIRAEIQQAIDEGKLELELEKEKSRANIEAEKRRCEQKLEETRRHCRQQEASLERSVRDAEQRTRERIRRVERDTERQLVQMQFDAERQILEKKLEFKLAEIEEIGKSAKSLETEKLLRELSEEEARLRCELDECMKKEMAYKMELEMEEESRCLNESYAECGALSYDMELATACVQERCFSEAMLLEEAYAAPMEAMEAQLVAAPAPNQALQKREQQKPQQEAGDPQKARNSSVPDDREDVVDYTMIPRELDRRFEQLDEGGSLRPTIINPGERWKKVQTTDLMGTRHTTHHLQGDQIKRLKDEAFDLLSALSCAGALVIDHASMHIVVAATHCFDKTVIDTVVKDNVNPIEKAERSSLIMATTIHKRPTAELLQQSQVPRIQSITPMLFN